MGKIRCVLIDDEPKGLELLKIYCEQLDRYCEVVDSFLSADKFLQKHMSIQYDMLFLDIDMNGMLGTELARMIKDKPIAFVTARKDYDREVWDLNNKQDNILTLIPKPLDLELIERAFKKYLNRQKKITSTVFNTDQGLLSVLFEDILLITTKDDAFKKDILKRYSIRENFHSRNKLLVTSKEVIKLNSVDFSDLKELLPPEDFFAVNRFAILARKAIKGSDTDGLRLCDPLKAYVSEVHFNVSPEDYKEFKTWFRR